MVGVFHSDHTSAYGGNTGHKDAENGGPGVVYLYGQKPLNKNLRIDNRGRIAVVKFCLVFFYEYFTNIGRFQQNKQKK